VARLPVPDRPLELEQAQPVLPHGGADLGADSVVPGTIERNETVASTDGTGGTHFGPHRLQAVVIEVEGIAVELNREDLLTRVHKLNGDVVLEEVMRRDSRVEDLKRRIFEVDRVPLYMQVLTTSASEEPLLDTDILVLVMEFANPHGGALELQLTICPKVPTSARGDAMMEIMRYTWDAMSTPSRGKIASNPNWDRPLFDYQGRWRASPDSVPVLRRAFGDDGALFVRVRGQQVVDCSIRQVEMWVTHDEVYLMGMRAGVADGVLGLYGPGEEDMEPWIYYDRVN